MVVDIIRCQNEGENLSEILNSRSTDDDVSKLF